LIGSTDIIDRINKCLKQKQNVILSGLSGISRAYFIQEWLNSRKGKLLCLVSSEEKAFDLSQDLAQFIDHQPIDPHEFLIWLPLPGELWIEWSYYPRSCLFPKGWYWL
jgi:transcription-repair coupling factor (superfamily II helicase)